MPAVTKSGPWGLPDDTAPPDFFQAEWRALVGAALATGRLGTGWAITATGASTQITVGPGVAAIQGWLALEMDGHVLDVATIPGAIAPAAGQTRIDYVVLTADPEAEEVRLELVAGTPATSGAIAPALTRSIGGVWQEPLATITRVGNVAVTSAMVRPVATYVSPTVVLDPGRPVPSDLPVGTVAVQGVDVLTVTAPGTVRKITNPDWSNLSVSGSTPLGISPGWRRVGGLLQIRGSWARTSGTYASGANSTVMTLPATAVVGVPAGTYRSACVAHAAALDLLCFAVVTVTSSGATVAIAPQGSGAAQVSLGVLMIPYGGA